MNAMPSFVKNVRIDHRGATSLWPSNSWIVRISYPFSKRWVAKECLKVWQVACFVIPAMRTAFFIARCTMLSWIWWRPCFPVFCFFHRLACGNTNCQAHSLEAFGYFLFSAYGMSTRPYPSSRSAWWIFLTTLRCFCNCFSTILGSMMIRSFDPFPQRTTISLRKKSSSFTRKRRLSINLKPAPYIKAAMIQIAPSRLSRTALTSSFVKTTGNLPGFFARITSSI